MLIELWGKREYVYNTVLYLSKKSKYKWAHVVQTPVVPQSSLFPRNGN